MVKHMAQVEAFESASTAVHLFLPLQSILKVKASHDRVQDLSDDLEDIANVL